MSANHQWLSLNAYLGAYGIKTSLLNCNDDYWICAIALWPNLKRDPSMSLVDLQKQIKAMSLRERKRIGKTNVNRVPPRFFSHAVKHQRRLSVALVKENDALRAASHSEAVE